MVLEKERTFRNSLIKDVMVLKPLNRLYSICEKHDLALVYLFGSQAQTGNKLLQGLKVMVEDHLTDLDVGVVTTKPLPAPDKRVRFYSTLYNDMEDLFKPYRLDLVLLEENHSVFQFVFDNLKMVQ